MKSLVLSLLAATALAARAETAFVTVGNAPASLVGKAVAVDVAATNAAATVRLCRVRNIKAWTNAADVVTSVYTNRTQFFDQSNRVWVATNVITTTTVTNAYRTLALDRWVTNEIVRLACSNGFATSNLTNAAWFVPGDFACAEGNAGGRTTVVIEK